MSAAAQASRSRRQSREHRVPDVRPKSGTRAAPVVLDLCSGVGGLSLAASQLGMHIVAGVDLSATAMRTFGNNFPDAKAILGSVRSSKVLDCCAQLVRQHSGPFVIVSGPPCQGFSAAGPRDPADPRNQILLAVARAVVRLKPHCALLENVSMVLANSTAFVWPNWKAY